MSDRVERALAESLRRQLAVKPVDKITIGDLTADCGISRSTFYYHYRDIYDLVEAVTMERFVAIIGADRSRDTWPEGMRRVMRELYKERAFLSNVYDHIDHDDLRAYLMADTEALLYDVVREESEGVNVTDQDIRAVAHAYAHIFAGTLLDWVDGGMREDIDGLTGRLSVMMSGAFRHSLRQIEAAGRR